MSDLLGFIPDQRPDKPRAICAVLLLLIAVVGPAHADTRLAQGPVSPQVPPAATLDTSRYGPLMRFARAAPRQVAPEDAVTNTLAMTPFSLQSADQRQILIEGMNARLRIADPARFERAFGRGASAWESARRRIQAGMADELRRAIGRLTLPQLAAFDPFVLVEEGTQLGRMLARVGLAIDNFDGDAMGYRTLIAR